MRNRSRTHFDDGTLKTAIFSCVLATLILFAFSVQPRVIERQYAVGDEPMKEFTLPLRFDSDNTDFTVMMTLQVAPLHTHILEISADDCIDAIFLNGIPLAEAALPHCIIEQPLALNMSPALRVGKNSLVLRLHNNGGPGGLTIRSAPTDPVFLGLLGVFALLVCFSVYWLTHAFYKGKLTGVLATVLCIGIVLRVLYVIATPYDVRGYDTDGHLEYMHYLVDHSTLPGPGDGWQWYQPPLYYMIGAPLFAFEQRISAFITPITALQIIALLCSIGVLIVGAWVSFTLFQKRERDASLIMLAIIATFPSLVFFASRINNDVLYHFFGALSLASLYAWWRNDSMRLWYFAVFAAAFSMLSKMNALLLLPLLYLCLLCKWDLSWKAKLKHAVIGGAILALCTEWFFAIRLIVSKQTTLVGNVGNLHSGLKLENTFSHLASFNPMRVMEITFNNPWSDEAGRQYFWEYLVRSSLFGEFTFPEPLTHITVALSILGCLMLAILFWGVACSLAKRAYQDIPLLCTLVILSIGHLLFRIQYPYSSSQDFRYSILLVFPVSYFIALAIRSTPAPYRIGLIATTFCFVLLCGSFLFGIAVY